MLKKGWFFPPVIATRAGCLSPETGLQCVFALVLWQNVACFHFCKFLLFSVRFHKIVDRYVSCFCTQRAMLAHLGSSCKRFAQKKKEENAQKRDLPKRSILDVKNKESQCKNTDLARRDDWHSQIPWFSNLTADFQNTFLSHFRYVNCLSDCEILDFVPDFLTFPRSHGVCGMANPCESKHQVAFDGKMTKHQGALADVTVSSYLLRETWERVSFFYRLQLWETPRNKKPPMGGEIPQTGQI